MYISAAAGPMFCGKGRKASLQEAAIEIGVVGDNEDHSPQEIVDTVIVDALTGDHLVGNAGDLDDLSWDRKTRIFEPLPAAQNSIDSPALPIVLEEADAQFDNLVAIGVGSRCFDIYDSGDELRGAIMRVVFGLRFQPTTNPIIAAFGKRSSHLFECRFHVAHIGRGPPSIDCHEL